VNKQMVMCWHQAIGCNIQDRDEVFSQPPQAEQVVSTLVDDAASVVASVVEVVAFPQTQVGVAAYSLYPLKNRWSSVPSHLRHSARTPCSIIAYRGAGEKPRDLRGFRKASIVGG
jgi:hypothetical protein